jgi:hypothetical protein
LVKKRSHAEKILGINLPDAKAQNARIDALEIEAINLRSSIRANNFDLGCLRKSIQVNDESIRQLTCKHCYCRKKYEGEWLTSPKSCCLCGKSNK